MPIKRIWTVERFLRNIPKSMQLYPSFRIIKMPITMAGGLGTKILYPSGKQWYLLQSVHRIGWWSDRRGGLQLDRYQLRLQFQSSGLLWWCDQNGGL